GGSHESPHPLRELGVVHVAEDDQGEDQQHTRVGVSRAPQVLTQRVFHLGRIADEEAEDAYPSVHDGGQHDEENARHPTRCIAHGSSTLFAASTRLGSSRRSSSNCAKRIDCSTEPAAGRPGYSLDTSDLSF